MSSEDQQMDLIKQKIERYNELQSLYRQIKSVGGVDKNTALSIESFEPGLLTNRININGYTAQPSKTNYNVTLEQLELAMEEVHGGIIAALIVFIVGIFSFLISAFSGGAGGKSNMAQTTSDYNKRLEETKKLADDVDKAAVVLHAGPPAIKIEDRSELDTLREEIEKAVISRHRLPSDSPLQTYVSGIDHANNVGSIFKGADTFINAYFIDTINVSRSKLIVELENKTGAYYSLGTHIGKHAGLIVQTTQTAIKLFRTVVENDRKDMYKKEFVVEKIIGEDDGQYQIAEIEEMRKIRMSFFETVLSKTEPEEINKLVSAYGSKHRHIDAKLKLDTDAKDVLDKCPRLTDLAVHDGDFKNLSEIFPRLQEEFENISGNLKQNEGPTMVSRFAFRELGYIMNCVGAAGRVITNQRQQVTNYLQLITTAEMARLGQTTRLLDIAIKYTDDESAKSGLRKQSDALKEKYKEYRELSKQF